MNDLAVKEVVEKRPHLDVEVVCRQDELKQGLLLHLDSSVIKFSFSDKMCECQSTWMKLESAGEMSLSFL